MPAAAAQATGPLTTGTGSNRRCTPSTITTPAAIRIRAAFISDASWVLRPKP